MRVGGSHIVYRGEKYTVDQDVVREHVPNPDLPARQTPESFKEIIAVYNEILHDDHTLSHYRQILNSADIERMIARAKAERKIIGEWEFENAARKKAFSELRSGKIGSITTACPSTPPPATSHFLAEPAGASGVISMRVRALWVYKIFSLLLPVTLYGYIFAFAYYTAEELGTETTDWFISLENYPALLVLILLIYMAVIVYMIYWIVSITNEVRSLRNTHINVPASWSYLLFFVPLVGGIILIVLQLRFIIGVNKLIGSSSFAIFLGVLLALIPPFAPFCMLYFQRRFNALSKQSVQGPITNF